MNSVHRKIHWLSLVFCSISCGKIDIKSHDDLLSLLTEVEWETSTFDKKLVSGEHHTCSIQDTKLYCWGSNEKGVLGVGSVNLEEPLPLQVDANVHWKHISTSSSHSCGLSIMGELYCWGGNMYGELGTGESTTGSSLPIHVLTDKTWKSVGVGANFTCGVTEAGGLYCWGRQDGQLGEAVFGNEIRFNLSFKIMFSDSSP